MLLRPSKWFLMLYLICAANQASGQTILVLGDSISAAYGIEQEQGWVNLLSEHLQESNPEVRVVNASISGDTTTGGLARLPSALAVHKPDLVIIELGGNDGLRGYPISRIRDNLGKLVNLTQESGASVLLVGMMLPPNYGKRYADAFYNAFREVSEQYQIHLLPFLLEGVATQKSLMQRDGIHPTGEAQPLLLERIWPDIEKFLQPSPEPMEYDLP